MTKDTATKIIIGISEKIIESKHAKNKYNYIPTYDFKIEKFQAPKWEFLILCDINNYTMEKLLNFLKSFHNKVSLLAELQALGADELKYDKVLEVIMKDRHCTSWYPWKEFCDPKELWEEQMMMAMNKNREDFQKRMEKEGQEFDLGIFEMNKKLSRATHRVMVRLAIAAIVFAGVQIGLKIWG